MFSYTFCCSTTIVQIHYFIIYVVSGIAVNNFYSVCCHLCFSPFFSLYYILIIVFCLCVIVCVSLNSLFLIL
ncbi:hypothetical protein TPE_1340 [Treponema pedis str. T A4]|uniref:Uncharacterized protein n=1 Tax=Treponema pedis str. T A4 TaxID=1291379 RepID=S5ZUG2_9SPIR|nr:hypothetical protein TPE_1340 [Treponema pedis str. T A4]